MKSIKVVSERIFDLFEIYLPMASFIFVFVSYIIMISFRYILHISFDWLYQLNVITYVWAGVFAASYGGRSDKHVVFSLIYDKFSEKKRRVIKIIGDLFTVGVFSVLLPYTLDSVIFIAKKKIPILQLPFSIIYIPYLVFIILSLIYYTVSLIKEIRQFTISFKGKVKL